MITKNFEDIFQVLFIAAIGVVIVYFSFFSDTERDVEPCRDTTRQQQVISKIDGDVTSYETQTIYGCETESGQFFARPED